MSRNFARALLILLAACFAHAQLAPLVRFSSNPSECAVIAGEIHECIAIHGEPSCAHLFDSHYDCVSGEIDASVSDQAGMQIDHRPYTRLTRGRHGFFLYHPFDIYFASSLELYGEWSELELSVVKDLVPRGGTILDIGSHIGTLTVPFAKHVGPNGFVIAIEAQRPIQALCQANAAINSLYNVRSINAAVDASRDSCLMTVSFDVDAFRNYGSHAVKECSEALMKACDGGRCLARPANWVEPNYQTGDLITWEWVQSLTIDDLQLDRVDFIKIDVEGFESRVLKGASETIRKMLPVIYFEEMNAPIKIPADGVYLSPSYEEVLKPLGYECFFHDAPYYNPDNWKKQAKNYFGHHKSKMMLCAHPAKTVLSGLTKLVSPTSAVR